MSWTVNQSLPEERRDDLSRQQLRDYAEASGDRNPIHLDEAVARSVGLPGVIVHGMLSMAFLADYLRGIFPEARYDLKRLSTRFRRVTFPDDKLVLGGIVKRASAAEWAVEVWAKNGKGEITADGEADIRAR